MNEKQAIEQLRETKEITTGMLEPLGIKFETFLRFSQFPSSTRKSLIAKLIDTYSNWR
jgi:hypothetical protein